MEHEVRIATIDIFDERTEDILSTEPINTRNTFHSLNRPQAGA